MYTDISVVFLICVFLITSVIEHHLKYLLTKPQIAKEFWEFKTDLEESGTLISIYTTKLQSLKQYEIGTNTEI